MYNFRGYLYYLLHTYFSDDALNKEKLLGFLIVFIFFSILVDIAFIYIYICQIFDYEI